MTVIAERVLDLAPGAEVVLRIFQPVQVAEHQFRCDYTIDWPDRPHRLYGAGVDAVQALLGAMQNAHADLLASPEGKAGDLTWAGLTDLGLPLAGTLTRDDFA